MFLSVISVALLAQTVGTFTFNPSQGAVFKMPQLEKKEPVNDQLTRFDANVGVMNDTILDVKSDVTDIKGNVEDVNNTVHDVLERLKILENMKTSSADKMVSVQDQVGKIASAMESQFAEVNKTLSTINGVMTDLKQSQDAILKKVVEPKRGATSCLELQKCSGQNKDGEYWLYPSSLDGSKIKVFCYRMNTNKPKEYSSLHKDNHGEYPNKCNLNCQGEKTDGCPSEVAKNRGNVVFKKIRMNIQTLVVYKGDKFFTEGDGKRMDYGSAGDCYNTIWDKPTNEKRTCGPKGNFKLDLTGTGLRFSSQITWKDDGWRQYKDVTMSEDRVVVTGYCGGWAGRCFAEEIRLEINPDSDVVDDSVQDVQCN